MQLFNQKSRKLAVVSLCFFLAGWIAYLIGSSMLLEKESSGTSNDEDTTSIHQILITSIFILAGGPLVFIIALLQAELSGMCGATFGALLAFPSTLFIMSISADVTVSVWSILEKLHTSQQTTTSDTTPNPAIVLRLTGALFQGLCWLVVLICSVFYKYKSSTRTLANTHNNRQSSWAFLGAARKISVFPIILSTLGWSVLISQLPTDNWLSSVAIFTVAPLLYAAMLLHAGSWGIVSTICGIFACILSVIYNSFTFVSLAVLVYNGEGANTIISGGVVSYFFASCVHFLWPFYLHYPSISEDERNRAQEHQGLVYIPPPSYGTVQRQQYTSSKTQPLIAN